MNQIQKPTYDELASAVLLLEEAWNDLFSQVCSNPVTNAWGKPVNFTVLNQAREQTSGLVYRLKELSGKMAEDFAKEHKEYMESPKSLVLEPAVSTLQSYLANSDDHGYNMKEMLIEYYVEQELRRINKNGEDQRERWLGLAIEERINNNEIPLVDILQAVFYVLEKVAKGNTK